LKEEPPKTLISSGLDAVLWFDLSRDECIRRAIGRRFDTQFEKVYHIEDVPPLTTSNKIFNFYLLNFRCSIM